MATVSTPHHARAASPSLPSQTPTTDFALLEAQKENIRPLASGRSAATLSSVFAVKANEVDEKVSREDERFRRDIEEAEKKDREGEEVDGYGDLLDVYNKYILFIVQHHPSSASHLLPQLEHTTRRFIDDPRYSQDIRYLKLWSMYARHVERREDIWAYLEKKDVGTKHALFYEEWAGACEALGRKKQADGIYRIGIHRFAAPLERLKTRHQAFLDRIMVPPSGIVPDDEPVQSTARTPGRSVLGQVAHPTGITSLSGATQVAPSTRQVSGSQNGKKMEIFSDGSGPADDGTAPDWADFGTRDGRRKENVVEPTPWKGETLPSKARIAPRTPKMEVFKDAADNEAIRVPEDVFSRSKAPQTEAELLRANPLKNFDTAALTAQPATSSLPPPPSARKPPKPSKHFHKAPWAPPEGGKEVKGNSGKVERRMFDWDNVFKGGEEWSFEEVRAKQRGLHGKQWKDVREWERAWHEPGSSTPKPVKKAKPPSPTVNTKLANDEVMRMFDQTIHGGKARDDSSDDSDEESDDDDGPARGGAAPTPLPTRGAPMSMMAPVGGMVPPTPTPAQGHVTQNRVFSDENVQPVPNTPRNVFADEIAASKQNVFGDENAVPPSASKKSFNVFSETPAKTPLANRTPLATATAGKPRAFGIFSDIPEETEDVAEEAAPVVEPPSQRAFNIFSTPAPAASRAPPRRVLDSVVPEEDDEEEPLHHVVEDAVQEAINQVDEEEEMDDGRRGMRIIPYRAVMTPITERTCEFTQMTQFTTLRSSQLGSSTRRTSPTDTVDSAFAEMADSATEEADRSRTSSARTSDIAMRLQSTQFFGEGHDMSGDAENDGKFDMPEGYTIHRRDQDEMNTVAIVDRSVHSAREETPELDGDGDRDETGAFVTANQGEPTSHSTPAPNDELPNPCDPTSDHVLTRMFELMQPPLSALPGFHDLRGSSAGRLDALQKHAKAKLRRASTSSRTSMGGDNMSLTLAGRPYEVVDKLGEGGFGAVFLAVDLRKREEADAKSDDSSSEDEDDEDDDYLLAIKVERPAAIWEAAVLDRIHRKLSADTLASIIKPRELFAFTDESYLFLDYSSQGTLLDVVNKAPTMGIAPLPANQGVDELVAIFFTIELLKTVTSLHSAGFIHGDLKIDNCLTRLAPIPSSEGGQSTWTATYSPSGSGGWRHKGMKLIDFGRTVDLSLWPHGGQDQSFVAEWKVDEKDCVQMREGRSWTYESDYWGLAGVAYCLLFGKYLTADAVAEDVSGSSEAGQRRFKLVTPLKRYWQSALWTALFDALLNPALMGQMPINDHLAEVRASMELWLEENCQKGGKSLRSMLKKIELEAIKGRRV